MLEIEKIEREVDPEFAEFNLEISREEDMSKHGNRKRIVAWLRDLSAGSDTLLALPGRGTV